MLGQIRSYISYITVDSDSSYINRINNMISSIDDDNSKTILINELNKKLAEIEIIRKYQTHKEAEPQVIRREVIKPVEQVIEEAKSFEDEIEEKVEEWKKFQETGDSTGGTSHRNLPSIYTDAYNLVKIYSTKPKVYRKMSVPKKSNKIKVKKNTHVPNKQVSMMPTLPIYDD